MPSRSVTPQQAGRDFEQEFAARYGASPVPGSGATPRFKLDVGQVGLLWSLKFTTHESYRLNVADVLEAIAGAQGPGSRMVLPAIALGFEGFDETLSVLRTSDLMAILRGEIEVPVSHTVRSTKRAAAEPGARLP